MGTKRDLPTSITGRLKAMTIAKNKKDGAPVPADNLLSATTSARLDTDIAAYIAGRAVVTATKTAYHLAIEVARPQRALLKSNISSFYGTMNNNIKTGAIPAAARGYYNLSITNRKLPKMITDVELLEAAKTVLSGDILRVAAGGIAMSAPTIAEFTLVLDTAKPFIVAITNAETAKNTAVENLSLQTREIHDLIKHIWDEVEAHYSLSTAAARRTQSRLWGVRYVSTGVPSLVTGTCKDELGVALVGIKVRIIGSSASTLSDAMGNFSLNTILYGDLELEATHPHYEKNITDFTKADGVAEVVAVVMVALV